MGIYPPWIRAFEWKGIHSVVSAGYAFIGEPPTVAALVPGGTDDLRYSVVLDWSRLILQWLLVAMVTAMAVLSGPRVERERSKGAAANAAAATVSPTSLSESSKSAHPKTGGTSTYGDDVNAARPVIPIHAYSATADVTKCPICHAEYPISAGVAHFGPDCGAPLQDLLSR